MNRAELEALLEKGRVWLAQQNELYHETGKRHKLFDQQLEKFCEYWSEWDDMKSPQEKGKLF